MAAAVLPKLDYSRFSKNGELFLAGGVVTILCVMLVVLYKYIRRLLKAKFADLKDRYEERTLFSHMKGSDDDGGTDA